MKHCSLASLLAACLLSLGPISRVHGVDVTVANPSFEAPAFADGAYAALSISAVQQGGYGWTFSDGSGIYNPPAQDYATAGGNGAPAGGHGAQVGWVSGFGDYSIRQPLAGPDGMLGNGDDPVLEAFTIYTLTFDAGLRAVGNVFGATSGGYDVQLHAGSELTAESIVARETDAVTLPPGSLLERSLTWDSALAAPERLGLPLTILLRKTIVSATADTDFDNIRLTAVYVPPTANFNGAGTVDGADLAVWRANFGGSGSVTPSQGDYDRNLRIDGTDFLWWQRSVGTAGAGEAVGSAPEPATGIMFLAGCVTIDAVFRSRRQARR